MNTRVIVVGSYNQDHVWHLERMVRAGETLRGHGFSTGPGGKGFNQAVACVRQGVATAFIGARGDDALGEKAARQAEVEHLLGCWQVETAHPTGSACILVDEQGQNRIIVDLGANEQLGSAHIDAQAGLFADARVLLAQMEIDMATLMHTLQRARAHDLLTLLNPAPIHPRTTRECLRLADVLLPNEGEFAELCACFAGHEVTADAVASMDDAPLHALARKLTDASVVITLGGHGCFVSHGESRRGDSDAFYRLAPEKVHVVDTTGAGDAFCGALAAASVRLRDQPFRAAVTHANRVGAMATEHHGAASAMPHHAEVMPRFATR